MEMQNSAVCVEKLQAALDRAVASGEECGVQLVIYEHGNLVADLCAGFADREHTVPVTSGTLFPVFSVGKGLITSAFHMLKERLGFDYRMRVADVWPEYGCSGKESTELWHLLSHRAGLPALPGIAQDDALLGDWQEMCSRLADAVPAWTPGSRCEYHAITFAWLIGETANRLLHGSFHDFFRKEVLAPLGKEQDLFFGLPETQEKRAAQIDDRCKHGEYCWQRSFIENPAIRRGFIPSANGFSTAGAVAAIYNALWQSEGTPAPFLRKETVDDATTPMRAPNDPPGACALFGLGYALPYRMTRGGDLFGHGGAAGSEGFYCKSRELALGFTKNIITPTHPNHPLRDEISRILGLPERHW